MIVLADLAGEASWFSDVPALGPRPAVETENQCNYIVVLAGPAGGAKLFSDALVLGPRSAIEIQKSIQLHDCVC